MDNESASQEPAAPKTATPAEVARPLGPRLETDASAARRLKLSPSTLRQLRFRDRQRIEDTTERLRLQAPALHAEVLAARLHPDDAARIAEIEFTPMEGPRWLQLGRSVRYPVDELDRWIDGRMRGVMAHSAERSAPRGAAKRNSQRHRSARAPGTRGSGETP